MTLFFSSVRKSLSFVSKEETIKKLEELDLNNYVEVKKDLSKDFTDSIKKGAMEFDGVSINESSSLSIKVS